MMKTEAYENSRYYSFYFVRIPLKYYSKGSKSSEDLLGLILMLALGLIIDIAILPFTGFYDIILNVMRKVRGK